MNVFDVTIYMPKKDAKKGRPNLNRHDERKARQQMVTPTDGYAGQRGHAI